MKKRIHDLIKELSPKESIYNVDPLKINLTTFQFRLITLLVWILTGSTRMDQLSDVLYASLKIVSRHAIRPIQYFIPYTRLKILDKLDGDGHGTSIRGDSVVAFNKYLTYLCDIFGDALTTRGTDIGDIIITVLLYAVLSDDGARKCLAEECPYVVLLAFNADDLDNIRLCVIDCLNNDVVDHRTFNKDDVFMSYRLGTSQEIMKAKSLDLISALDSINSKSNDWVNLVYLRLDRQVSSMVKTGELECLAWDPFIRVRRNNLFSTDEVERKDGLSDA